MKRIFIPKPELQINFSYALGQIRNLYLQDALSKTITGLRISKLDRELSEYAPENTLNLIASHGLRGELIFPVPYVLKQNPFLLGYYRLLLGFSQKEFYTTRFGVSRFKSMEEKGVLTKSNEESLDELCTSLSQSCAALIDGIGIDRLSKSLLDDLMLLTVGPQLRGGANVKKGVAGIVSVFQVIHEIVSHATTNSDTSKIEILNAAGRKVTVEFAPDPDIVIREEMSKERFRNIIAIEVKGGTEFSNIHNRVGEAEKSHQKAKAEGYVECWTVVNVDNIDLKMAKKESPSTNTFYKISDLQTGNTAEYLDFKERIISLTGIKSR
ncbi:MAG: XcyI family restriction endonuclease [Bacteroidales bacterium]|nr:XcyI family restriction endonuclease [Bacteroidales bacterium]MCF8333514.1 XcyI family restriction endonuclease [Bacteroidales bacterium]